MVHAKTGKKSLMEKLAVEVYHIQKYRKSMIFHSSVSGQPSLLPQKQKKKNRKKRKMPPLLSINNVFLLCFPMHLKVPSKMLFKI